MAILTVNVIPSDADIKLYATGFVQEGNYISVNVGTTVSVVITKLGYKDIRESITVTEDITKNYEMEKEEYTVEFSVYPEGTTATTTINGVSLAGFSRTCYYGDLLSYSFEKEGYETRQGTIKITGSETRKIILIADRNYVDPDKNIVKLQRDMKKMYPAQFTDKKLISNYINSVVNPFFEKPDEVAVIGYIGKRNQDTESSAQFIIESTADRQNNQLVPVAITNSDIGEEILTFKNYVGSIKESGIATDNQNKFLHSKQWSWSPLINVDMLINYSLYHWLGYDQSILPHMEFLSYTNAVRDIIGKKEYSYSGLVALYEGETYKQEYESTIPLYDGMRIKFLSDSNPEYNNIIYTVTGVGGNIRLIPDSASDYNYIFDKQDYYVMETGSIDDNDWSLSNKWVHRRVLEIMAPESVTKFHAAERPIICYQKNYELYNHGTFFRGYVDVAYDGPMSDINGTTENLIQGITIKTGMIILFKQISDVDLHQIFVVNKQESGLNILQPIYNGQDTEDMAKTILNDYVRVKFGDYAKKTLYYNGEEWVYSQTKTKLNQEPLFKLYDSDGVYVGSEAQYPLNNFKGGIVFDYYISDDESLEIDPYIEKRIVCDIYGNYDFVNSIATSQYEYIDSYGEKQYIKGYMYAKNIVTGAFNNSWLYKEDTAYQRLVTTIYLTDTDILNGGFSYIIPFKDYNSLLIFKNGKQLDDTDYIMHEQGFTINDVRVGDEIRISFYALNFDELPNGYAFELPLSYTSNQFNENIERFNIKDVLVHLSSILQNQIGFEGNANGSNNSYALDIDGSRGTYIIQSDNPILLPMVLENNEATSILHGIMYASKVYQQTMDKVRNLSSAMIRKNVISENDYSLYYENPTLLDDTIRTIFKQINLGKNENSPFANNGVAAQIGDLYIPSTPAFLGLQKPVKPVLTVDENGNEIIICHDGAIVKANHSVVDLIRYELELSIYNSIYNSFKTRTPMFSAIDNISGYYRKTDYTREQYLSVYAHYFVNWAIKNSFDFTDNTESRTSDWKGWNWSCSQMEDGTLLKGSYRAIYKYFFDTVDPSQTPWEMFGFNEKPSWWDISYGEAPYTSNNLVLWDDVEKGYIRGENRYDLNYARPTIKDHIPVDIQGNLISPFECHIATDNPTVIGRSESWKVGDISDVEYEFMKTSEYKFVLEAINYILRPVEWIGINWNTQSTEIKYAGTIYQQTIDVNTEKRPSLKEQIIHNTYTNGIRNRVYGMQQWIVDSLMKENKSIDTYLVDRLFNLEMKLGYCAGSFYEKGSVELMDDNTIIPSDNVSLKLIETRTGKTFSYSGVKIVKADTGFVITGFDNLRPCFKVLMPIKNNRKSSKEVNGVTFTSYLDYDIEQVKEYPYGTLFETPNDVINFLKGYEKYLTLVEGWNFMSLNSNGELIDFNMSIISFMTWTTTEFIPEEDTYGKTYPLLIINPGATAISLTHYGNIRNALLATNGQANIVDINSNAISQQNFDVSRNSFLTTYSIGVDYVAGMYRAVQSEFENIVLIDCKTVFGDVLYNPIYSIVRDNLHLTAIKAAQWNGSLYSPGYLNLEDGLIPNLEKNVFDLNYIFDVDDIKCQIAYKEYSKTLIGYAKTKCMQDLIRNEKSMFDFYKGMIADKGTIKPIIAMNRSSYVAKNSVSSDIINEYWAFKAGEYGQVLGNTSLEFLLDSSRMRSNPQSITYSPINGIISDDTYVISSDSSSWLKRNISSVNANLARKYTGDIIVPPVGFVNLEDVDYVVSNMTQFDDIVDQVVDGQTVFIVDDGNNDWNVVKKSGEDHFVSMRYDTLLDAYKKKTQDLVYEIAYNDSIYYVNKSSDEIELNDLVYTDINLTTTIGTYKSLGLYSYTGNTVIYPAMQAYKTKLYNTVFKTTTPQTELNKDSLLYCYADNLYYPYSSLMFKLGSAITQSFVTKRYRFTLRVENYIENTTVIINGTSFNLTKDIRSVTTFVDYGTIINWEVIAPHCKTVSGVHEIIDVDGVPATSIIVPVILYYKDNEYIYDSVADNRGDSKFSTTELSIGCKGTYEITMNGAGGGAGGGATYFVDNDKNARYSNVISNEVHDLAKSSSGTVTYLGSIITNNTETDSRSAGQGGAAGGYIKGIFTTEYTGLADIIVGKGGQGGICGITVGVTGTNGTATEFNFHDETNTHTYLTLLAGGGAAGMGALTNQYSTGSTNEEGKYVATGIGGIVLKSGDSTVLDTLNLSAFSAGLSSVRVSGAGAAPTMNPDGFNYMTPLYNECGFGGKPAYMDDGENGDNGRLQIKFIKSLDDEVQPESIIDEYVEEFSIESGETSYSLIYQRFVLNTWSAFNPLPDEWISSDKKKIRYMYGDCVSYEGKKYYCKKSHNNSHNFDTTAFIEYTNYMSEPMGDLPFYTYGIIGYNPLKPEQEVFEDSSILYKNRARNALVEFNPTVIINGYQEDKQYEVDDVISSTIGFNTDYKTYKCIKAVKGIKPTEGANYWIPVSYTNEQEQDYDDTVLYHIGDVVVYNGQLYQCIKENTSINPDIFWVFEQQNVYIKCIMDKFYYADQKEYGSDYMESYFPLYWDEDCQTPVIDDNNIQLEYGDLLNASFGDYVLVDSLGSYGDLKLTYLSEPYWNDIQSNGCYLISSGMQSYYTAMDSVTMDSYKGTENDVVYRSNNVKSSTLAYQYNNQVLKYSDLTDVITSIDGNGYELTNEENIIYVKEPFGHLTNESVVYSDEKLSREAGTFSDYIPQWAKTEIIPNSYELSLKYPFGNSVYIKNENEFTKLDNEIFVKSDDEYIEFVPASARIDLIIPGEEVFYSDKNGTITDDVLYLYNGEKYIKVNPTVDDIYITYYTCNLNGFSLLKKIGNEYIIAEGYYVKKNDEYVSFETKYFSDMLSGFSKILYNSNNNITTFFDLYKKTDDGYVKLSGDLYSPLKALDSLLYFEDGVASDRIAGIVRNGNEKSLVGMNGYFNSQCMGINVGLNHLLTTRNQIIDINIYRDIENDSVYNLARELQQIMITDPVDPVEWCKEKAIEKEKQGSFIAPNNILELYEKELLENQIVQRTAEIFHYYYSDSGERKYLKLYHYDNKYYISVPCEATIFVNMFTCIGTESDLITFYKQEHEEETIDEIVNAVVYKNDGDLLYITNDKYYNINVGDYKDIICDIYGINTIYSSKTLEGEYGWIKAEVLGQDYEFNLAGIEDYQADNTCVKSVFYVDNQTDETLGKVTVVDPMEGIYSTDINEEVKYVSAIDPVGSYDDIQNINKIKLGDLWWDISKVKYLNYKQRHSRVWWYPKEYLISDNSFKASNWVKQLPGSQIIINEWTSSKEPPANIDNYITNIELDEKTKLLKKVYYYWNPNPIKIPYGSIRTRSANTIAESLNADITSGLMMFAYTDYNNVSSSFMISNYTFATNGQEAVVQINLDLNKCSDSHSDWDMVKENTTDKIPEKLWNQLRESLIEYRTSSDGEHLVLPDPNLPESMKYGIQYRPRQSMIKDTYEAKRNLVGILNNITLNRTLVDATDVDSDLLNVIDEPISGSYSFEVEQYINLKQVTDPDYIGKNILVKYDENYNNIWTIYYMNGLNDFILIDWQKYNIKNFYEFEDLYVSSDIEKMGIIATVENIIELYSLDANEGDIARMYNDGKWNLYQKHEKVWELVGKEDALLKFTDALYSYEKYKNDESLYINLSKSVSWHPNVLYYSNMVVKVRIDDDNYKYYRCKATHTSREEFDEYELNYWVEIYNETLYDYKKNEADICLTNILEYFAG